MAAGQRRGRRVSFGQARHLGGKLMARGTVQRGLILHRTDRDIDIDMAVGLRTRRIDRNKSVNLESMAGHAHDVVEIRRIGFEVGSMPRRLGNPLPHFRLASHVARFTDLVRDWGVWSYVLRPL